MELLWFLVILLILLAVFGGVFVAKVFWIILIVALVVAVLSYARR